MYLQHTLHGWHIFVASQLTSFSSLFVLCYGENQDRACHSFSADAHRQKKENSGKIWCVQLQEKELTSKEREEMETYWMPIIKEDDRLRGQNVRFSSCFVATTSK